MKILRLIDRALTGLVNTALVGLFSVMMILAVVQVFLRYFFNSSVLWGDIANHNLVIWVGFLGAVMATRQEKHFRIDVLTRFLKPQHRLWFQCFSNLFGSVVCFYLGQASVTFLGLDAGNRTFLNVPSTVVEVIIPVGFYLMMLQFIMRAISDAADALGAAPAAPSEAK